MKSLFVKIGAILAGVLSLLFAVSKYGQRREKQGIAKVSTEHKLAAAESKATVATARAEAALTDAPTQRTEMKTRFAAAEPDSIEVKENDHS